MSGLVESALRFLGEFVARFRVTRDTAPIDSLAEMQRFARTRAAFVSQTKLFCYLKTRMGTQFPKVFENDRYVESINIAKLHVFAAALSDLTIHVVAKATAGSGLDHAARTAAAVECFDAGINEYGREEAGAENIAEWKAEFRNRVEDVHWENAASGHEAFARSPDALLRWAPIADELKRFDAKIVRNSMRFAWNEVIRDYRLRMRPLALQGEIATGGNGAT